MAQTQGGDPNHEVNQIKGNMSRLEQKIEKIQNLIESGQKVELDDLKALNRALQSAHVIGAAW